MALEEVRTKGVKVVSEDIRGQDGSVVPVREIAVATDEVILDPESPLAVQIPEGSGADHSRHTNPLADSLGEGHVEAKFGTAAAPLPSGSDSGESENEHIRSVGDTSGDEHVADHDRVDTPEVHNKPETQRVEKVARDIRDESPAPSEKRKSSKKS